MQEARPPQHPYYRKFVPYTENWKIENKDDK